MPDFIVLRLNGNPLDTYAAETLPEACELAMFDEVHHTSTAAVHGRVSAPDAGAARLMEPEKWEDTRATLQAPAGWSQVEPGFELPGTPTADPGKRRTGIAAIILATSLLFSGVAHSADATAPAAPSAPKAPRAKPISTISVKVQPVAKLDGKEWKITTVDQDGAEHGIGRGRRTPGMPQGYQQGR